MAASKAFNYLASFLLLFFGDGGMRSSLAEVPTVQPIGTGLCPSLLLGESSKLIAPFSVRFHIGSSQPVFLTDSLFPALPHSSSLSLFFSASSNSSALFVGMPSSANISLPRPSAAWRVSHLFLLSQMLVWVSLVSNNYPFSVGNNSEERKKEREWAKHQPCRKANFATACYLITYYASHMPYSHCEIVNWRKWRWAERGGDQASLMLTLPSRLGTVSLNLINFFPYFFTFSLN